MVSPSRSRAGATATEEASTKRFGAPALDTAPRRGSGRWLAIIGGLVVLAGLGVGGYVMMGDRGSNPWSVATAEPRGAAEVDDVVPPPGAGEVEGPAEGPAEGAAEPEDAAEDVAEDAAEPAEVDEPAQQIVVPAAEPTEDGRSDAARKTGGGERAADAAKLEGNDPAEPKPDVAGLMQQAKQKRDAGQKGAAEALYQQVLARQPRNKEALSALGELAFAKGNASAAAKYFARATKVSPKDGDLRIKLGDALFKLGQLEKARTEFAKAAATGHPQAIRRLQIVDAKLGK
jgi:TolA-binding protein